MTRQMKLILTLIGICLLWVAVSSEAGPLLGFSRVVDIKFTGYLDGLHMTINPHTGQVLANRTGSGVDPEVMWGTVGALLGGTYRGGAVTLMNPGLIKYYTVILDNPKWWIYYKSDGGMLNKGEYTVGVAAIEEQGLPCSSDAK